MVVFRQGCKVPLFTICNFAYNGFQWIANVAQIRSKQKCGTSTKRRLTKRAPDAGDSAAISGSFLRLSIFLAGRLRRPRPSAGNANR